MQPIVIPKKLTDPSKLFTATEQFRASLKCVSKTLEREVKLLQQLNFEEVSESISQLKYTTNEDSHVRESLTDFEISFQTLGSIIKSVADGMIRECIDPLKNFIKYDFKDINSLKKQYDERVANKKNKPTSRQVEKQGTIVTILNEKVNELELKQETKMLDYFARFWINWGTMQKFQNDQLQRLIQTITDKNTKSKGFVNAIKEGHLLVKKKFGGWVSNYFILKDGKLIQYNSNDSFVIYDLFLCSLKSNYHSSFDAEDFSDKHKSRFEIVSAKSKKMKSIVLQAENPEEKDDWFHKISQQIQSSLSANALSTHSNNTLEKQYRITSFSTNTNERSKIHELLSSVPGNDKCCDCFADNPDWAIINMGTLVCQDCSGIHRNFGVQVSKVRSLVLDVKIWTPELIQMFMDLGNKQVNSLLLSHASIEDISKFRTISTPSQRDALLKMKYVSFKFTGLITSPNISSIQTDGSYKPHRNHTKAFSCVSMNELIAEDKLKQLQNSFTKSITLLQNSLRRTYTMNDLCELIFEGDISNILLALMNDFNIESKDKHSWTLLHYAAWYNKPHICLILIHHKANKYAKDLKGFTPEIVAELNNSIQAIPALNGIEPQPFTIVDISSKIQENNTFGQLKSTVFPPQYPTSNSQHISISRHRTTRSNDSVLSDSVTRPTELRSSKQPITKQPNLSVKQIF
ncbi:ARF GTPase activating protein [Entamoeba marina]